MKRCEWSVGSKIEIEYHDKIWGVPEFDDRQLFRKLTLDGAQAGLSWITILKKTANYDLAFDNFDVIKIANYSAEKIAELLQNKGIIRNKLKINSVVNNAKIYLKIQKEFGSFSKYIWSFTNGKTINNKWTNMSEIPSSSKESDAMAKDMKKRGFKFVGTTICYAFMQAIGMVNDHTIDCFRYEEIKK
ncbi:MAG: DNA-3-methyladenine glycosylase I [Candidatus Cloacimonetes bacterium]|jgi:DNA-3-methyladenine glycosylase I|nr:DNA-3-methyladenine glycosylase I [Candidatus Cloacimonadota bacterium]MBT6994584.1 DNA-3-methyladenine glycosylase I [Candidatus Cloacimonadota bacterium]MBT7470127.1 DNA-3-methyladenine glycosylase I [Candidatus Cloacimonadota bacterium]